MKIKVRYERGVLKPLGKLSLREGEEVEVEIKRKPIDKLEELVKISNVKWIEEIIESPDLEPI